MLFPSGTDHTTDHPSQAFEFFIEIFKDRFFFIFFSSFFYVPPDLSRLTFDGVNLIYFRDAESSFIVPFGNSYSHSDPVDSRRSYNCSIFD